eukprot:SAG31_NODE_17117_length_682_cov_10.032590_1_plen_151_part_10
MLEECPINTAPARAAEAGRARARPGPAPSPVRTGRRAQPLCGPPGLRRGGVGGAVGGVGGVRGAGVAGGVRCGAVGFGDSACVDPNRFCIFTCLKQQTNKCRSRFGKGKDANTTNVRTSQQKTISQSVNQSIRQSVHVLPSIRQSVNKIKL